MPIALNAPGMASAFFPIPSAAARLPPSEFPAFAICSKFSLCCQNRPLPFPGCIEKNRQCQTQRNDKQNRQNMPGAQLVSSFLKKRAGFATPHRPLPCCHPVPYPEADCACPMCRPTHPWYAMTDPMRRPCILSRASQRRKEFPQSSQRDYERSISCSHGQFY